jgi:hypothetical protein
MPWTGGLPAELSVKTEPNVKYEAIRCRDGIRLGVRMQNSISKGEPDNVGRGISRLATAALLATLGLAIAAFTGGCGGGGGGTASVTPTQPIQPVQPSQPAAACVNGTVASYIGTSCSQGATVYNWSSYTCTSTPSSICDALGTNGSNLAMHLDPKGPYTLLIGQTELWNVTAGQSVDVVISGTVSGAASNANWPHFNHGDVSAGGQTGDGTEENITTVNCATAANCLDSNNGVSDIPCSATSPPANCTEQATIAPYSVYKASFRAAPSTAPYGLTIEIKLNGGTSGTATLYSVGTHLIPGS